ncbi:MAG: hypothetical protein DPW09_22155 [Anaerolineae bacterium]|nr:hypothetical protein [Anaerolineae bacterium]
MLKLKLKNFRRFLETETILFQSGLTIVSGPNGAGKSTMVESLIYALYGPKRGQMRDIRSDNATEETGVECELVIDGQLVKICRFNDRAELWINNTLQVQGIPSSLEMANRQLGRLLGGLTRDQFEATYVALQGDTAGLVEEKTKRDRDKRREIIESVLQLEVLKKAVELQEERRSGALHAVKAQGNLVTSELGLDVEARELLRQFENARKPETRSQHAQRFQAIIEGVVSYKQTEADTAAASVGIAEGEVKRLESERDKCQLAINAAKDVVNFHDELQTKHQNLALQIAGLDGQVRQARTDADNLNNQIAEAEKCESAAKEHEQLLIKIGEQNQRLSRLPLIKARYEALTQAQTALRTLNNELNALMAVDEELRQVQVREAETKNAWEALQDDPTTTDFQDLQGHQKKMELEKEHAEAALETLQHRPDEARCPTCDQKFVEHTPKQRIQHLSHWLNHTLPTLHSELKGQEDNLKRRQQKWQRDRDAAYDLWQQEFKKISPAQDQVRRRNDLRGQLENLNRTLGKTQQEWDELSETTPYDPQEEVRLQGQLKALDKEAADLKQQAEHFAQLSQLRGQLTDKEDELKRLHSTKGELVEKQSNIGYDPEVHRGAKESLSNTQDQLNKVVLPQLNQAGIHLTNCEANARQARDKLRQVKKYQKQFAEGVIEFQREDRLYSLLSDFQTDFFATNTKKVAQRARQLLLHAITDQSILGIQFDGDNLYYLDASQVCRSVSRLSGGEKALVGLCLRIALAEQAQAITNAGKVRLLILDEVLSSLDDERREAVQRIFEDVQQRGIFEHIVMITHLDTVKHNWRGIQLQVEKVDTKTSRIVFPEQTSSALDIEMGV